MEIERKFLVDSSKWAPSDQGTPITQAYLGLNPAPTVRVRIAGDKAYITIKGRSNSIARPEFEYEIPLEDAKELLRLAITEPVEKTRYEIWHKGFLWEVDIFGGKNKGLIMAEIELEAEDQEFERPEWILQEVSEDGRFYNSYLSGHPFQEWKNSLA